MYTNIANKVYKVNEAHGNIKGLFIIGRESENLQPLWLRSYRRAVYM